MHNVFCIFILTHRLPAEATQTKSNDRKTGIKQEYGAIFLTPLSLIVDINITGNGISDSLLKFSSIILPLHQLQLSSCFILEIVT